MKLTRLSNLLLLDAALLLLLGGALIFAPARSETLFGFAGLPSGVHYILGLWGCMMATMGLGYIVAAGNPLRHLVWVQVGIARGALECVLGAICLARGVVGAQQAGLGITVGAFITIAYLVAYPRTKRPDEKPAPSPA